MENEDFDRPPLTFYIKRIDDETYETAVLKYYEDKEKVFEKPINILTPII